MIPHYNLKNIRTLLTEGFTDEELRQLCYDVPDFRSVYDRLSPNCNKAQIVNQLLEHTDRKLQIETLLNLAKKYNPRRYEEHQPYYDKRDITISYNAQRKSKGGNKVLSTTSRNSTSWLRKPEWVVPIVVALIGLVSTLITAVLTSEAGEVRGRQTAVAELQPTITVLSLQYVQNFKCIAKEGSGHKASDFRLKSLDGEFIALNHFRGKPVVLYFMASDCDPCKDELPKYVEVYKKYKDRGLMVLFIEVSEVDEEYAAKLQSYFEKYDVRFPILVDEEGGVLRDYASVIPTSFFIDPNGDIQVTKYGGGISRDELQECVNRICSFCEY